MLYNFKSWKEALQEILKCDNTDPQTLNLDNPRDVYFLKIAAIRYKTAAPEGSFTFAYPAHLGSFSFQFHTAGRVQMPAYSKAIQDKLVAMKVGEEISVPTSEARIEAVRSVAYGLGNFKVIKTDDGCSVRRIDSVISMRSKIQANILQFTNVGDYMDMACEPEMTNTVRAYVSQSKEKEQKFTVSQLTGKGIARITRTK